MSMEWVQETKGGPVVRIRVTPRSRRAGVRVSGGRIVIDVHAPPEAGKATEEALRLLAGLLGVAPSLVRLAGGAASRDKRVLILGQTASDLRKRLNEALSAGL